MLSWGSLRVMGPVVSLETPSRGSCSAMSFFVSLAGKNRRVPLLKMQERNLAACVIVSELGEDVCDPEVEPLETGDDLAGIVVHHGMNVRISWCDVGV